MKLLFLIFFYFISALSLNQRPYLLPMGKVRPAYNPQETRFTDLVTLPDRNNDGFSDFVDFMKVFEGKSLNNFELQQIYSVVDQNNDGLISRLEWSSFYGLFVGPYVDCYLDTSFKISGSSLYGCLVQMRGYKVFNKWITGEGGSKRFQYKIQFAFGGKENINFHNYLEVRRAMLAWDNCAVSYSYLTKHDMPCVATYMNFELGLEEAELDEIFYTAVYFSSFEEIYVVPQGREQVGHLSFLGLLGIFTKRGLFMRLMSSVKKKALTKMDLLNAIKKNAIEFDPKDVKKLFEGSLTYQLNFRSFYILMKCKDLTQEFSHPLYPGYMDEIQFGRMLSQRSFTMTVATLIDDSEIAWSPGSIKALKTSLRANRKMDPEQNSITKMTQDYVTAKSDEELAIEKLEREYLATSLYITFLQTSESTNARTKQDSDSYDYSTSNSQVPPDQRKIGNEFAYWMYPGPGGNMKSRRAMFNIFGLI